MEIHELEAKKMAVMKEIADMNMIAAQTRFELSELEKKKEQFFIDQQDAVLERIHGAINNSRALLQEANTNYENVHQFYDSVKKTAEFVSEVQKNLVEIVADFNLKSQAHKDKIGHQEDEIARQRKMLQLDEQALGRDKEHFSQQKKELEELRKDIAREHEAMKQAYKILEEESHGK